MSALAACSHFKLWPWIVTGPQTGFRPANGTRPGAILKLAAITLGAEFAFHARSRSTSILKRTPNGKAFSSELEAKC